MIQDVLLVYANPIIWYAGIITLYKLRSLAWATLTLLPLLLSPLDSNYRYSFASIIFITILATTEIQTWKRKNLTYALIILWYTIIYATMIWKAIQMAQ